MLILGCTEMGLSVDDFMQLSWYEWGLECLKLKNRNEYDKRLWETGWEQSRQLIAMIHNMSGKVARKELNPKDIITLSFDKKGEVKPMTAEDVKEMEIKFLNKNG